MKKNRPLIAILFLALIGILTSACSGRTVQASGWPGLNANDTTAFLAYNSHVFAIDLANGTEKWRYPAEAEGQLTFYAVPSFGIENQLVVGDYSNNLRLLDVDSGSETIIAGQWPFEGAKDPYIAKPLATDDGIFAASSDGQLYALNYQGNALWASFATEDAQWAAPASDEERLYLPSLDHHLYAIDRSNGREIWRVDMEGALVGTPALNDAGVLFVGTFGSELVALDSDNGRILWEFTSNDWIWSGPAIDETHVYFGDLSGEFYAVNQTTGNLTWSYTANGTITAAPLITAEGIYFTTETGSLIALNQNGAKKWEQTIEGKLHSSPVAASDKILVAPIDNDAYLFAYNLDGAQVWTFVPQN